MSAMGWVLPFAAFWVDSVHGAIMLQCMRQKSAKIGPSANLIIGVGMSVRGLHCCRSLATHKLPR